MKEKILITSALLYSNGPLHFGHVAGAYLPADCYARFQRLKQNDVLFISGSDEYGIAITLSAEIEGRSPKEQVDHYHKMNQSLFDQLGITFDHYSRTTWEGHKKPVQEFFLELLENGYIEEKVTDQLYSDKEGRFLADRYVVGECPSCGYDPARGDECPKCGASYDAIQLKNPRSKVSGAELSRKPTKHWFLLLNLFKERLTHWLSQKEWKSNVVNFIKGYVENLHPRAITRDTSWGIPIPLPNTEGKVLYVWFDAPIGYISATMEWALKSNEPDKWKDYWLDPDVRLVNFIGKDNIPFHAAIFPAMIMGQNRPYKLVDDIPANEFYNLEGRKFSKSEGWFIHLEEFLQNYTADQIRFAIASNAPETTDSEFTWKDFQLRCNSELLGKYGNLVNRVMVFARKQCGANIPAFGTLGQIDKDFLEKIDELTGYIEESFSKYKLRQASRLIMELAAAGNVYFDAKRPWKEVKENPQAMQTTVRCCLECLKALAMISCPVIPEAAGKVWKMLGNTSDIEKQSWDDVLRTPLVEGGPLGEPEILFRRIEDSEIENELEKLRSLNN